MSVERLRSRVNRGLSWLLVGLMGFMVLNVLWQVFTRFVLRDPSSVTEEIARYLLIWLGLLGAACGVGHRVHISIDLLRSRLSGRRRAWIELVIEGLVMAFALGVLVAGGIQLVSMTLYLGQVSAALQIRLGYVYLALPLSGILIAFYSALAFWEVLHSLRTATRQGEGDPA